MPFGGLKNRPIRHARVTESHNKSPSLLGMEAIGAGFASAHMHSLCVQFLPGTLKP
jgi:hypothetical protein